jgi:glycosyltransferase involved in cell wall biosynthesis
LKKKVYISVINDLVTDQRVHRIALTIRDSGYDVTLIGRKFKDSQKFKLRDIRIRRFRLWINKGFFFYACYNIKLFFYLLFRKGPLVLVSNDLDTLPANFFVAKLRRGKLIYDSHEYFTEVPELIGRNFIKKFWLTLEKFLVPRVDAAYTVNDSLAKMYSAKYGLEFGVLRNVPDNYLVEEEISVPDQFEKEGFILYQGSVNKDRGLEDLIDLIATDRRYRLAIAGTGDMIKELQKRVREHNLHENVNFFGKIEPAKLKSLTRKAYLGLSLEKKTNLNYYYALPNKLFDYLNAGIPVLCSDFPEMKKIVENYNVGMIVDPEDKRKIKEYLELISEDDRKRKEWSENARSASRELSWEKERKKIVDIYKKVGLEIQVYPVKNK